MSAVDRPQGCPPNGVYATHVGEAVRWRLVLPFPLVRRCLRCVVSPVCKPFVPWPSPGCKVTRLRCVHTPPQMGCARNEEWKAEWKAEWYGQEQAGEPVRRENRRGAGLLAGGHPVRTAPQRRADRRALLYAIGTPPPGGGAKSQAQKALSTGWRGVGTH